MCRRHRNYVLTRKIYFKKASRPISTYKLNTLLYVHFMPINLVVSEESLGGRSPREILSYSWLPA
jgi:hypothetical protein